MIINGFCNIGMSFIKENISKLEKEKAEHMPIGFEVAFPSLLEIAQKLGIEVPDSPFLKEIYKQRNVKLTRYGDGVGYFTTLNREKKI